MDTSNIMAYIVALTGGIGSGKSTIANIFARNYIDIIDADMIARQVVKNGTTALAKITKYFGDGILLANGTLDRAQMRQRIFSQPNDKKWLQQLLQPLIHKETERQLAIANSPYALWVVPLLVENGLQDRANRVLVTDVNIEIQQTRTIARDGITLQQLRSIVSAQSTREQRVAIADDIIDNNDVMLKIEQSVATLHYRYLKLATSIT